MGSKEEIQKKYTDLKNRILELNESYHRHDISEVSDEKYDSLTVILTGGDANKLPKTLKNSIFAHSNFMAEGMLHLLELNIDS